LKVKNSPTLAYGWYWIIDLSTEKLVADGIKAEEKTSVNSLLHHRERCAQGRSYVDMYEPMLQIVVLSILATMTCLIL
jgi:hypothetical protein